MPVLKVSQPQISSFRSSSGIEIARLFNKTPESIVCPHFWELKWAWGCPFNCAYCYLQGTFRGDKRPRYKPLKLFLLGLDEMFLKLSEPTIFNSGELSDSLMEFHDVIGVPRVKEGPILARIEQIADKFEEQSKHKLLLLTKSHMGKLFAQRSRKQTIASFSLNATEVWRRWEHRTPPPKERVRGAKALSDAGYEVRVRIDPVFPIENWKEHYEDLVYSILSEFSPERITLGTPRGLAKTLLYSPDMSWRQYFTKESEHSGWGKKIPTELRKEIYLFFYEKLANLGFPKTKIALCKETELMWRELGLDSRNCRCNCVW